LIPRPALGFWRLIHRSALGFVADLGFLPSKGAPSGEGGCGHGVIKLTLVTVVHVIVQRETGGGGMERFTAPVPYRVGPYDYSPAVKCPCNRKAPCWTSWSDDNLGRRYYRYPSRLVSLSLGFPLVCSAINFLICCAINLSVETWGLRLLYVD